MERPAGGARGARRGVDGQGSPRRRRRRRKCACAWPPPRSSSSASILAEAKRQLEPSLSLLPKLADRELEASVLLLQARLELMAPRRRARAGRRGDRRAPSASSPARSTCASRASASRAGRSPRSSRRCPTHDPSDRVGALVRELRLIAIYEQRAPEVARTGAGRWCAPASAKPGCATRAATASARRAALRRALAVAEASRDANQLKLQQDALDELSGFYFARERFADVRALFERRLALEQAKGGRERAGTTALDRCWLDYWAGDGASAGHCFGELRAGLAKSRAGDADWAGLEFFLDEAVARSQAGDPAAARSLLGHARADLRGALGPEARAVPARARHAGAGRLRRPRAQPPAGRADARARAAARVARRRRR